MRPIVSAQHASVNFLAAVNVSIVTAATLSIDFAWSIMRFSLRVGDAASAQFPRVVESTQHGGKCNG